MARKSENIWGEGLGRGLNLFAAKWTTERQETFASFMHKGEQDAARSVPPESLLKYIKEQMLSSKKDCIRARHRLRKEKALGGKFDIANFQ